MVWLVLSVVPRACAPPSPLLLPVLLPLALPRLLLHPPEEGALEVVHVALGEHVRASDVARPVLVAAPVLAMASAPFRTVALELP